MEDIFEKIIEMKKKGTPSALAIVIRTEGSVPRKPGAKMVVTRDGNIFGTLGGGDLENRIIKEAIKAIEEGKPKTASFTLDMEKGGLDMMCGGTVEVFIEPLLPPEKLIIFGAGHITRSLAPMMKKIGFHVIIVDDTPQFLQKEYFPDIEDIFLEDMPAFAERLSSEQNIYVVVLSRGFSRDKAILGKLLKKDFRYIGMIGSKRKMENVIRGLKEEGIPDEAFLKLKSPVGLDIGAETPEEIAISIAGEIIAVKKGKLVFCNQ
ncbi:MAG TPA: XdhC family protein [Syntrophorhabdaceae bacterium]|nr:XdhC family protein [Syntrophorhabdaceae bacterium]